MDISQGDIERIVQQVLRELGNDSATGTVSRHEGEMPTPQSVTPARVDIGRVGTRYPTAPYLEFLLAHAAARDAVLGEVAGELIERLGLLAVESTAKTKDEFVANADLGRHLTEQAKEVIAANCRSGTAVQLIAIDGLSSAAIETNLEAMLRGMAGLAGRKGWSLGRTIFVRHGRLGVTNEIGQLLSPEVAVTIVGERPGLATIRNIGAYVTYRPGLQTTEAGRNLVSNIHQSGTTVEQALEKLADLLERIFSQKTSGVHLK
jgi:ethanolamine ammonia-lyase small subunit